MTIRELIEEYLEAETQMDSLCKERDRINTLISESQAHRNRIYNMLNARMPHGHHTLALPGGRTVSLWKVNSSDVLTISVLEPLADAVADEPGPIEPKNDIPF